jgi:proteasome lid subunit RPN8/RPN11
MLTLKNYCFSLILGVMVVWAQEAASVAPVPVEKEPLHHVMLKNESIMVMHLVLPAGERTLYHTHSHDRIAVNLSSASITQQKLGDAEGASTSAAPGSFSALTLEGSSQCGSRPIRCH